MLQYFSVFAVPDPGANDTSFEITYQTDGDRAPWYEEKFYQVNTLFPMNFQTFVVLFFLFCLMIPACIICYCCYKRKQMLENRVKKHQADQKEIEKMEYVKWLKNKKDLRSSSRANH